MNVKPDGSGPDLRDAHRFAVDAARAAGRLLREGTRGRVASRAKNATGDLVTDLDLAAERLIVDRIRARWPEHGVIAEEGGEYAADDAWAWLVDPLDGTNNVAIGLSAYVVGIALCERGSPVVGVVHDPVAGRTWSAVRGRGAFVHESGPAGRPLHAPHRPVPTAPVLAWTQGHGVARDDSTARALKVVLDTTARRVLQLWAPLLSWVMLARGDIDGIVGYRAEAVDLPAGALLAQEAGIEIRALDGGPFEESIDGSAEDRSFVAAHPRALPGLLALLP
jgi:myo-inositol-1(or 4)-monophosphatase